MSCQLQSGGFGSHNSESVGYRQPVVVMILYNALYKGLWCASFIRCCGILKERCLPCFFWNCRSWIRPISVYNVSTVRASEQCSIIANSKSTTHFSTSYRWSAYVTPNFTKGGSKRICRFLWMKFKFIQIKSGTKFLCVKTCSGKVVTEPTVYRCWW